MWVLWKWYPQQAELPKQVRHLQHLQQQQEPQSRQNRKVGKRYSVWNVTDKPVTLTYWLEMAAGKVTEVFTNMNETALPGDGKRTGVKIDFYIRRRDRCRTVQPDGGLTRVAGYY
jgi:hypothetical protein